MRERERVVISFCCKYTNRLCMYVVVEHNIEMINALFFVVLFSHIAT